jgi:hypothetical protein
MTTIERTNNTKNAVEIRSELATNGITVEYIVINGQKCGVLGSASEKDKEAAIKTLQTALDASDGNLCAAMQKLNAIATMEEHEIKPDEMVRVCGREIILSYEAKTAYTIDGEEIADCKDLDNLPNEAIKALLIARAEVALN